MRDAVRRTIDYVSPEGKHYRLADKPAILFVRPRGWHLSEKHVLRSGKPIPGALFDFGLFIFHNAREQLSRGTAPYFYLPKLESHLEARLWAEVFAFSEEVLGIPHGSIRATVLIETITATFELHEILYELRDWIVALNCGRWDYIFSYLKKLRKHPEILLPDRAQVTMTQPFLRAYSRLVIQTCHRRGALAMGGMAAQIPIKNDPAANDAALAKVRADKEREAGDGHDGTWVAHPALVPVAMEVFDRLMPTPNQLDKTLPDFSTTQKELLTAPIGTITEAGLRGNISVSLRYMASWLSGQGCVPIFNLMEDAATAEISRTQLWQWVHHPKAALDDGRKINAALYQALLAEEMEKIKREQGASYPAARFESAQRLLSDIVLASELQDFLTLPAYERLIDLSPLPLAGEGAVA
jgi:malate synthase